MSEVHFPAGQHGTGDEFRFVDCTITGNARDTVLVLREPRRWYKPWTWLRTTPTHFFNITLTSSDTLTSNPPPIDHQSNNTDKS